MQQKNSADNFFQAMQSNWKDMMTGAPASPFDMKGMMEASRKNFQAMSDLNKQALQGWKTLAQRQSEMVSQFIQDNAGLPTEVMSDVPADQKIARQTAAIQDAYQRSIANTQELAGIAAKCTKDAADIINNRIVATMSEIRVAGTEDSE